MTLSLYAKRVVLVQALQAAQSPHVMLNIGTHEVQYQYNSHRMLVVLQALFPSRMPALWGCTMSSALSQSPFLPSQPSRQP